MDYFGSSISFIFPLIVGYFILAKFTDLVLELNEYKENLEEQVSKRTEQLLDKEKQALIGTMTSGFAHDILNPLHTIVTTNQMIQRGWGSFGSTVIEQSKSSSEKQGLVTAQQFFESLDHSLESIEVSCKTINDMTEMMKTLASPHSTELIEELDIRDLLLKTLSIMKCQITKTTEHFSTDISKEPVIVLGDSVQIQQIFLNLITNALQAIQSPSQSLEIFLVTENKRVIFSVIDSGVGLNSVDLTKVTDPYYSTRTKNGGTGLGLYMVKHNCEEHNGMFHLYSNSQNRTVAEVTLPLVEVN